MFIIPVLQCICVNSGSIVLCTHSHSKILFVFRVILFTLNVDNVSHKLGQNVLIHSLLSTVQRA